MQQKSLGLVALIVGPGLLFGLVFSIPLLLAPAKPTAADCGPTVSVAIRRHQSRWLFPGAVEERRSDHEGRQGAGPVRKRSDDQRHGLSRRIGAAGSGLRRRSRA